MELFKYIKPGMKKERYFSVDAEFTAKKVGSGTARVLSTPSMIAFMEQTSRDLLAQYIPKGFSSVGVEVNVRHLAPTPMGSNVRIMSEVLKVDELRVLFSVNAWDDIEKVGEGEHQRVVIDEARFLRRVEAKRENLSQP